MAVDDEPCHSMSTQEVAARLRGPVASRVNVTMYLIAIASSFPLPLSVFREPTLGEDVHSSLMT